MHKIPFKKMHGLGNDFVVVDHRGQNLKFPLNESDIQLLGNRRRGVGFDQLVVLEDTENADIFMRIYNQDGSEAGACGNATRCVASLYALETGKKHLTIETISGLLSADIIDPIEKIRVNMGVPKLDWQSLPAAQDCNLLSMPIDIDSLPRPIGVNVGNPHAVFFIDRFDGFDIEKIGAFVEHHALFPKRINVEFAQILDEHTIRMRVWERGAGITEACGTGACATAIAAIWSGKIKNHATLKLDGGTLDIEWAGIGQPVFMTGSATLVFEGQYHFQE